MGNGFSGFGSGLNLNTGRTLANPSSPCETSVEPCLLFGFDSESNDSHIITITEPRQFKAFGLSSGESIELIMVYGSGGGDLFEPLRVNGSPVLVTANSNYLLLATPGRYRFHLNGMLGDVTFVCEPVPCCNAEVISRSKLAGGGL